ncbi:MAG: tetratricopeptide repeat protein, partial [Phycisphaerales bacterium JB039]
CSSDLSRARDIFTEVIEAPAAERARVIESRCAAESELRREVESLLRFHSEDDGFLERPALEESGLARAGPLERLAPGAQVGGYRISGFLGAGGMGVVYSAEQESPRRLVALKLIRPGLVSTGAVRRFGREAAALGRLRHPGIARIYEAGEAEIAGATAPYLAMELVEGQPLTRHARQAQLNVRQRLELFALVCDAVAHAHERGVVHRDLKPGNIIVESPGGAAASRDAPGGASSAGGASPKILDFGVARIVATGEQDGTDGGEPITMHTRAGQLIGTLAYMAPEQATGDSDIVDTRADVYALGAILYELLAGQAPIDVHDAPIPAAVRAIAEREPAGLGTIDRQLRGDIETIVRKALEKDPARRYASAAALGEDIRRHLDDLPIAARPPSAMYQLRKFSRRHRAAAGAAVAVGAVLSVSVVALGAMLARATTAEATARREAVRAGAVAQFLDDMLSGISPEIAMSMDTELLRAILDRASQRVHAYSEHPLIEADIRMIIADSYDAAGLTELARPHLEQSLAIRRAELGRAHADAIASLIRLGEMDFEDGDYDNALVKASEAEALAQEALGQGHAFTLWAQNNIATYTANLGRPQEVDALSVRVLDGRRRLFGPDHPDTLVSMSVRMHLLWDLRRLDEAAVLGEETLERRTRVLGAEHPETLISANNLAALYYDLERIDDAIAMHERILEVRRRILGSDHPHTLATLNNLASACNTDGRDLARAEELFVELLERIPRVLGEEHPNRAIASHNLARLYRNQDRFAEAEPHSRLATELAQRTMPEGHWQIGALLTSHGATLIGLERYDEAEAALLEAHAIIVTGAGPEHPAAASAARTLARLYEQWGRPAQADRWRAP